ncbi:unnamed protein product [Protopolystoma xenopodis]|uniref:Uncharacterized protein n=1 Tax=Protopolystoma xenopodis TaxID=117903 RepID=A0A3S5A9F0_9PLAT|nr:unnamed protein product [Protopolystoma xenopodis]
MYSQPGPTAVSISSKAHQHPQRNSSLDGRTFHLDPLTTAPYCGKCLQITEKMLLSKKAIPFPISYSASPFGHPLFTALPVLPSAFHDPYGDQTRKRKMREAIDIVRDTNLMNRRLEEGVARPAKRRRLDQGSIASLRKSDRDEESGGGGARVFGNKAKTSSVHDVRFE